MIGRRILVLACLALMAGGTAASAQSGNDGRIEVAGGARWIGPLDFADVQATETTLGGGTRPVFGTATTLDGSIGATGIVAIRLSRQFQVEFGFGWNPTMLTTRITSDVEGIPDVSVDAAVTQFQMEGGVLVRPSAWSGARLSPFLTAGGGYLRQLNDGRTLVESGRSYYFGAGLYYERHTSGGRRLKASGLRIDGRGVILQEGVSPDDTPRLAPSVSAALFVRF